MPFEQVTPLPVPPIRLSRYTWPDRGHGSGVVFDVSWATQNGQTATMWGGAGGAGGQGTMQHRYEILGALKGLNQDSAFNPAGSFVNFPVVVRPTQAYTPWDGMAAAVFRTFWSVPILPDAIAVGTFGVGLILVRDVAPALTVNPVIFVQVTPAGLMEVVVKPTGAGVPTVIGDITSSFPGVDLLMRTEFWLFARNGALPARCEIYFGGVLAFTVPETDIPRQDEVTPGDLRFEEYSPLVAAGRAPQTVGQVWHGPCDWFASLQDRSGAVIPSG